MGGPRQGHLTQCHKVLSASSSTRKCLGETGDRGGLSYVTKAQKRWAGGPAWPGDPGGSETTPPVTPLYNPPSSSLLLELSEMWRLILLPRSRRDKPQAETRTQQDSYCSIEEVVGNPSPGTVRNYRRALPQTIKNWTQVREQYGFLAVLSRPGQKS